MRRVIQLTVTISFLTVSPLFAQELARLEWRAIQFPDAGFTYSGKPPLLDTPSGEPPASYRLNQ